MFVRCLVFTFFLCTLFQSAPSLFFLQLIIRNYLKWFKVGCNEMPSLWPSMKYAVEKMEHDIPRRSNFFLLCHIAWQLQASSDCTVEMTCFPYTEIDRIHARQIICSVTFWLRFEDFIAKTTRIAISKWNLVPVQNLFCSYWITKFQDESSIQTSKPELLTRTCCFGWRPMQWSDFERRLIFCNQFSIRQTHCWTTIVTLTNHSQVSHPSQ